VRLALREVLSNAGVMAGRRGLRRPDDRLLGSTAIAIIAGLLALYVIATGGRALLDEASIAPHPHRFVPVEEFRGPLQGLCAAFGGFVPSHRERLVLILGWVGKVASQEGDDGSTPRPR
jgi:hypothetical protein